MSSSKASQKLPTPEAYAAFISQIDLLDIWLSDAHVKNHHGPRSPRQAAVAVTDADPTWTQAEQAFEVRFPYSVQFLEGSRVHAEISVTFGLRFSSNQPMTDGFFAIFKDVNLPINTWPFLREFVSTTMGRMGWQSMSLPALKQGVDDEDAPDEEPVASKRPRRATSRKKANSAT